MQTLCHGFRTRLGQTGLNCYYVMVNSVLVHKKNIIIKFYFRQ